MIGIFKKDLIQSIRAKDSRSHPKDSSDSRFLIEIINDSFSQTIDPEKQKIFLQKGIELTGMNAESLSERVRELGYEDLSKAYRNYREF